MKKYLSLFALIFLAVALLMPKQTYAGDKVDIEQIKKGLPAMLGANNVGKEFWFSIPPCFEDESGGFANFIKIFITAPTKTLVTVEVPGKGYFKARNTIPNDVIEYNITPVQGQPYTKTGTDENVREAVFPGTGIHIYADDPLVVYCVVRYRATSDGWLVIPVSSLGREYILAGHPVDAMFRAGWNYKLPCVATITAPYDDTKVRFTLGGTIFTKTKGGMTPGQTKEWTLMKGDVLAISNDSDEGDLSGSKVVSTKPVGCVTGNMCNNIPTGNQWCDYTAEMDIPTFTWGLDLHVGKIPYRKNASIIRVFAKEPNTKIFRNGLNIGTIATAGGIEGKGFQVMRMTQDMKPGSVVISGDKPITVTLYNTGVQEDGYPLPNSDPFVMATTPVQQYQKEITFCTPGIMGGQNFKENYVNLVYETNSLGMMPDDVEFGGPVHGGQFDWVKCNVKFAGMDELFKYDVNGKKYALKMIQLPADGVYKIRAAKPFAAYSFGYDWCDSYGFPTAAALADLETPDTVAPVPTYKLTCDGNVTDGVVTDMPEDKAIRSNLSMIVFQSEFSFNYIFKYVDFIPGDTRTTNWTLQVVDPSQDARAVISFMDRRGNDSTIEINYLATKITIRPNPVDFGSFKKGEEKIMDFWAINYSDQSDVNIKDLKLQTGTTGFTLLLPPTLPGIITKLDSIKFQVKFVATEEGTFKDSIGLGDDCVFFYKSYVTAKVGNPVIAVTDVLFNTLSVGKSEQKEFQVTNEGTVDLVITGYTGPSLGVYVTGLPFMDKNNPYILKPKDTKSFTITFTPNTIGTFPDKIVFTSDAGTDRKNYCDIMGAATTPGLKANNAQWPKLRITRPGKLTGPYDDPAKQAITLSNDGSEDVNVTDFTIEEDIHGYAFEFDRAKIQSVITVPKQVGTTPGSVYIPVTFHPDVVGYHKLKIKYVNSAGIDVHSTFEGWGILPQIATYNYDFDTTTIQVMAEKKTRKIVFKNLDYSVDGQSVADVATITDLVISSANEISLNGTSYNPNPWTFNKSAITFPIVLQVGDSVMFNADFVAQVPGPINASVSSVSDAQAEVTSNWKGYGVSQLIRTSGGSTTTCIGSLSFVDCIIENYGTTDINVTSLELQPSLAYVYFTNSADAQGFKLKAHTIDTIRISYLPTKPGTDNVTFVVNSDAQGMEKVTAPITVTAVAYQRDAKLHTTITPDANKNSRPVPGTDAINVSVTFDGQSDLTMAKVDSVTIDIAYNSGIVQYINGSARVGAMAQGWSIAKTDVQPKDGKITFTLKGPGTTKLNGSGEILWLSFATFLPTSKDLTDATPFVVHATNAERFNSCLLITSDSTNIRLDQTCAYDLRSFLRVTGNNYALSAINPNPVGSNGASLNFSVGLDGYTNIEVFNMMGEKIKTLFDGNTQSGAYTIALPVEELSNGTYWIRMQSGQFRDEKQLFITK